MFKFRGFVISESKRVTLPEIDEKGYIYGYGYFKKSVNGEDKYYIYKEIKPDGSYSGSSFSAEVIKESIGISIGLVDCKKVEIYSGDIYMSPHGETGVVKYCIETASFEVLGRPMKNKDGIMKGTVIGIEFKNPDKLLNRSGIDEK